MQYHTPLTLSCAEVMKDLKGTIPNIVVKIQKKNNGTDVCRPLLYSRWMINVTSTWKYTSLFAPDRVQLHITSLLIIIVKYEGL